MGSPGAVANFVGRESELRRLAVGLHHAAAGLPKVVVIAGEAGIGKSRLVEQVLSLIEGDEWLILRGGGVDLAGLPALRFPFGMFTEALRWAVDAAPEPIAGRINHWIDPRHEERGIDPVRLKHEHLLMIVRELAALRPVVLVLEDMHWADESSLAAIIFLVRHLTHERLALIITTRYSSCSTVPHHHVIDHLQRLIGVDWLDLPSLPHGELAQIVAGLGVKDIAVMRSLVTLAEGNVLAAVQMAVSANRNMSSGIPDSVREAVARLWRKAPADVKTLLRVCAVIGRDIPYELVESVLSEFNDLLIGDLDDVVERAIDIGLLEANASGIRFRHELERRRVLESGALPLQRRVHAVIATILQRRLEVGDATPSLLARIAGHWSATNDRAASARACLAAGLAAAALNAYPEALEHLDSGLRDWKALDSPPPGWSGRYSEAVMAAASAARWAGQLSRGLLLLTDAVRRLDGDELVLAWERIGWFERELGNGVGARRAYRAAMATPSSAQVRARAIAGSAALEMTAFHLEEAHQLCQDGLSLCGDQVWAEHANLLCTLGVVQALLGQPDQGWATLRASLLKAEDAGSDEDIWRYVGNATFVLQNVGRTKEAVELALEGVERAKATSIIGSIAVLPVVGNAMCGLLALGRWQEALELSDVVHSNIPDGGPAVAMILLTQAEILVLQGSSENANGLLDRVEEIMAQWPVPSLRGHTMRVRAESAGWSGDIRRSIELIERGLTATSGEVSEATMQLCRAGARWAADMRVELESKQSQDWIASLGRTFQAALTDNNGVADSDVRAEESMFRCEIARWHGNATSDLWSSAADAWTVAGDPYQTSYALSLSVKSSETRVLSLFG